MKEKNQTLWSIVENEESLQETLHSVERKSQQKSWELQESINIIRDQQEELVHSAKMSTIGDISIGLSHEINNPLSIIMGKLEILKECLTSEIIDRENFFVLLNQIQKTSERISNIITVLQLFPRENEADATEIIAILPLIREALSYSQDQCKTHGIEILFDGISSTEASVKANPAQLLQVLNNLINNSINSISFLNEKWIEVKVVVSKKSCAISITDSGRGLSAQIHTALETSSLTMKEAGVTGVGLNMSKRIIEKYSGRFLYDANASHTRFVIELPLAPIR